uniref:Uncharacterized protein n=1 Tax=uncultured bacterium F42-01 TaxID=1191438 RepID=I3VIJ5_9BACT|nr:hypothetical protein [uncultured bacterium F42-01]
MRPPPFMRGSVFSTSPNQQGRRCDPARRYADALRRLR